MTSFFIAQYSSTQETSHHNWKNDDWKVKRQLEQKQMASRRQIR